MLERRHPEVERDGAAQADGEGRDLGAPVAGVGHDDRVGGREDVAIVVEEGVEGAGAELLLPLEEEDDAEVGVAGDLGERADRGEVRRDAGLVIRGAATVEAVAAQGRLEGQRVPVGVVAGRLHVVVGVEQHGRASVAGRARREPRRRLAELARCRRSAAG